MLAYQIIWTKSTNTWYSCRKKAISIEVFNVASSFLEHLRRVWDYCVVHLLALKTIIHCIGFQTYSGYYRIVINTIQVISHAIIFCCCCWHKVQHYVCNSLNFIMFNKKNKHIQTEEKTKKSSSHKQCVQRIFAFCSYITFFSI